MFNFSLIPNGKINFEGGGGSKKHIRSAMNLIYFFELNN